MHIYLEERRATEAAKAARRRDFLARCVLALLAGLAISAMFTGFMVGFIYTGDPR